MNTSHAHSWQQTRPEHTQTQQDQKVSVKVRKQGWITKGEKAIYSIMGMCVILAGIFIVSFSSSTDTVNRELQQLEKTIQHQQANNEALSFEVKELSRPERITKIARDNGLKIQDAKVKQAHAFNN